MSQIIVTYWSGTGNTEAMANAIGKGIEAAGNGGFQTVAVYDPAAQAEWEENKAKADFYINNFKELLEPSSFLNRL